LGIGSLGVASEPRVDFGDLIHSNKTSTARALDTSVGDYKVNVRNKTYKQLSNKKNKSRKSPDDVQK
jgi:hypothetical protein